MERSVSPGLWICNPRIKAISRPDCLGLNDSDRLIDPTDQKGEPVSTPAIDLAEGYGELELRGLELHRRSGWGYQIA